jgi:hypothetical protein
VYVMHFLHPLVRVVNLQLANEIDRTNVCMMERKNTSKVVPIGSRPATVDSPFRNYPE